MKSKLLAGWILSAGLMFAGGPRVSVGVQIGGPGYYGGGYYGGGYYGGYLPPPPPPPAYAYYRPPMPGPGFAWVGGYYYPYGNAYRWQNGYWMRPPQGRGRWYAPRHNRGRYQSGYWR